MRALLAAMPLLLAAAPPTPSLTQAEAFLRRLYAPYVARGDASTSTDDPAVFTPELRTLIREDVTRTPEDEVPTLNGDPICDCQDYEPLRRLTIAVRPAGHARAVATVRFRNGPQAKRLTYRLEAADGGWRVADIASAGSGSLVVLLRRASDTR